jgi:hypothetical protein
MDFDSKDLLIDFISLPNSVDYQIDLELLSTRSRHALKRVLMKDFNWQTQPLQIERIRALRFISLGDISSISVADIQDIKNVGRLTIVNLLDELQNSLSLRSNEPELLGGSSTAEEIDTLEELRSKISSSETIEALTESMFDYQRTLVDISEREERVWRERLPWATDNPRTLESIAQDLGVTRERVRQIQRKSTRYSYEINSKIDVLSQTQNMLLETTNLQEFQQAMFDEELVENREISLGRIRYLALELNQQEVVSDVEKAVYKWSQGFVDTTF